VKHLANTEVRWSAECHAARAPPDTLPLFAGRESNSAAFDQHGSD
jgi:hypothetical protein